MAEYSFDVVYKVDEQELSNAINQALKEANARFDFRGSIIKIEREKDGIVMAASDEMKIKQLIDLFQGKLVKRDINLKAFKFGEFETNISGQVKCKVETQNGLSTDQCKIVTKKIKDSNLKVTTRQQGDAVRVTGKSKDDLQSVMKMLRESDLEFAVSFDNYR
ncbi:MAG: YajQ family cyclic di-GMP-binding protein [Leptonema sp. (in: Bacteria)]|nr:YajQ family cyclic di-GMP-binding protein [Leptonema sp. (in: bacteria)]